MYCFLIMLFLCRAHTRGADAAEKGDADFENTGIVSDARPPLTKPGSKTKAGKEVLTSPARVRSIFGTSFAFYRATVASHAPFRRASCHVEFNFQEEFDAEIRRLGALCETRTKELNRVRLELRDTAHALSALTVAFQRWDEKLEK